MTQLRPLRSAATGALKLAPGLGPFAEQLMWRSLYELASIGRRDHGTTMMNYGYAPLDPAATAAVPAGQEDDHYGLQLYAAVAGASELKGKDVLEVGCGRGGGAAFLFRTEELRTMTGVDRARRAIARCRHRYARPGLRFIAGDAEALPFADGSFDVVLSVESSHCYAHPERFWREAHRVLRPGGRLLLADARHTNRNPDNGPTLFARADVARLRDQLAEARFRTLEEEDITANVVRALKLDTPIRRARIETRIPRFLRAHALAFAAIEGSPVYEAFAHSNLTYLRFVLERE